MQTESLEDFLGIVERKKEKKKKTSKELLESKWRTISRGGWVFLNPLWI